jgi:hypothetical protein
MVLHVEAFNTPSFGPIGSQGVWGKASFANSFGSPIWLWILLDPIPAWRLLLYIRYLEVILGSLGASFQSDHMEVILCCVRHSPAGYFTFVLHNSS